MSAFYGESSEGEQEVGGVRRTVSIAERMEDWQAVLGRKGRAVRTRGDFNVGEGCLWLYIIHGFT